MRTRLNVVRQPRILIVITFLALLALIIARAAAAPYPPEEGVLADMPLSRLIDGWFSGYPVWSLAAGVLLLSVNGILISRLIDKYQVSLVHTYLPLIMYLLMAYGIFTPFHSVSSSLTMLLLIISSEQMIAAFKRSYSFNEVFNSAFCLGFIPMLYSPGAAFILVLPLTLGLYQRTAREMIVAAGGLLLPFALCTVGWWAAGYDWSHVAVSAYESITADSGMDIIRILPELGIPALAYTAVFSLLVLYSVIIAVRYMRKMRTRARKIYIHFIALLALALAMSFIPSGNVTSFCLFAIPASVISSVFFIRYQGLWSLLVYVVLIVFALLINTAPLIHW